MRRSIATVCLSGTLEDKLEAGIALTGTEVKSLRFGEGSIAESYAEVRGGEAWLVNSNVPEFSHGNRFNHEPKRPRKLLLHRREVDRLQGAVERKGMTLVPMRMVFVRSPTAAIHVREKGACPPTCRHGWK